MPVNNLLITCSLCLSFSFSYSQDFKRIDKVKLSKPPVINSVFIANADCIGEHKIWFTGRTKSGNVAGIYDTLSHAIYKSKIELEGFHSEAEIYRHNNDYIIFSDFGEEDSIWEIKIYEFANNKLKYRGSLGVAKVVNDSIMGDMYVFPAEVIKVIKRKNKLLVNLPKDQYIFHPGTLDQRKYYGALEFEVKEDGIIQK